MEKAVTLKNVTLMWPCLNKPNSLSGKFQVDVLLNDSQAKEVAKELRLDIRSEPDKGKFVTPKSKYEIKALDLKGNPIKELVGNGSKANLIMNAYDWTFKNKSGRSPGLLKLVVTELVEYKPGSTEGADESSLYDTI